MTNRINTIAVIVAMLMFISSSAISGTDGYGDWYVGKFRGNYRISTSEKVLNIGTFSAECVEGSVVNKIEHLTNVYTISNAYAEYRVDGQGKWTPTHVLDGPDGASYVFLAPGRHPILDAMMTGSSYIEIRGADSKDRFQRSTYSLRGSTKAIQGFLERCNDSSEFKSYREIAKDLIGETLYMRASLKLHSENSDAWDEAPRVEYDESVEVLGVSGDIKVERNPKSIMLKVQKKNGDTGYLPYNDNYTMESIQAKGWDPRVVIAIANGSVIRGMTEEQVIESWGESRDKNDSYVGQLNRSQWIYTGHYLYFESGLLTDWQAN